MCIFDPHLHMTSRTTDDYEAMHAAGVLWRNPVAFHGQSGRLELDEPKPDEEATFQGNSIRRGGA